MPEYEDSDGNESHHSLDIEYGRLNVPSMRTSRAPRRSTREKNVVSRFGQNDYKAYHYAFMMKMATIRELETFSEVAKDSRWVEAMNEEMQALSKNETLEVLPSSPHQKATRCRWIYKVKHNADGIVNQYKARLVAKGLMPRHTVSIMKRPLPRWQR